MMSTRVTGEKMWDLDPLEAINNHYSKVLRNSDCCHEQVLLRQVVDEVGPGGSGYQWEGKDCCCARIGTLLLDSSSDLSR